MRQIELSDLNARIENGADTFIAETEAAFENRLEELAEKIISTAKERPITLIAGPSGSGKTTTARKLEHILDTAGYETHTLSMDDYYADGTRNQDIVDQFGMPDYESPLRLDMDLLNTQLGKLARCEEVELPRFDFAAQRQLKSGVRLRRKENELIIMEGIHALNPQVTGGAQESANRVYLSVRTRITLGGERLHPSMIRFARRLLRDARTRGRTPRETFEMLSSISRGENLYIMPYKHLADFELDTFMDYELAVYRPMILETVRQLAATACGDSGLRLLLSVLEEIRPMDAAAVPARSLVREFLSE